MTESSQSVGQRMAKGAGWSVLSRLCVRGLGFISTLILARLLMPEDFGLVVLATTCVGVLEIMGEFGLDTVLIAKQDSPRALYDTAWSLQILRGLVLSALVFLGADGIAWLMDEPRLITILHWLALSAFLQGFINIGIVEFRKELMLQKELQFQVTQKLFSFFVTLAFAYYWRNYWALVAGIITGQVIGLLLSYLMSSYRPRFDLSEWRTVFHFSKWLVFINLLNYASSRGDSLIIGSKVGAGAVGYYGVANEVASMPTNELVFPIQRAIFPGFSKIAADKQALKKSYLSVFTLVVMLAAPLGVGIALVAEPMVKVLLGEKWLLAIPLIEILALSGALRVMGASSGSVMYAMSEVRVVAFIGCINTVARIGLLFWWVSIAGAEGAAWAIFATTIFSLILNLGMISKLLDLPVMFSLISVWRTFISLLVMASTVYLVQLCMPISESYVDMVVQLVVLVPSGGIAYIASHLGLWMLAGKPASAETLIVDFVRRKNAY